jgi:eukaryotic-like serine/threonine-protein kinase
MCEYKSGIVDNKYQLSGPIGKGGFASVYEARMLENDEIVAIKFYSGFQDEVDMPRFHREVKIMSLIDHKNVIKILDYNIETSNPYIVMPLAKYPLSECIEDLKSSEELIINIFLQVCEGVKELHKNGIYHRDIKASNILISQSDEALIADLGLARLENRDLSAITGSYDWAGTEMYTLPEFYSHNGYKNGDERGDIFQLGQTLYNLLTGRTPGVLYLESLPSALQIIISQTTQNNPNDRYQSVDQLINHIENYLRYSKPDSNPEDMCDFYLEKLSESSVNKAYDSHIADEMLKCLYSCKSNDETFLKLFDKIPFEILIYILKEKNVNFEMIIKEYSLIMENLAKNYTGYNFEYADSIAKRMKLLYKYTCDIRHKTTALKIILKISVAAYRYTAMETFDNLLKDIKNSEEGRAISIMLNEEIKDHSKLIKSLRSPVPVSELHYSLRSVRRSAVDFRDR